MSSDIQSKKWQITQNNIKSNKIDIDNTVITIEKKNPIYYCCAEEIGDKGTRHLHVFIVFASAIRFSTLKKMFPKAHIEKALGSIADNIDYIRKEGKHLEKAHTQIPGTFKEYGVRPVEKISTRDAIKDIMQMFKNGSTVNDVIERYSSFAMRIDRLDALRDRILCELSKKEFRDLKVYYIYGETGTGKTSYVYKTHGMDICRITNYGTSGMFDAYHGQEVIVFEEYASQIPIQLMLTYLDIYPVELPARYYSRTACYNTVYILSNIPFNEQYEDIQLKRPDIWKAFCRRITSIRHQINAEQQIYVDKEDFLN